MVRKGEQQAAASKGLVRHSEGQPKGVGGALAGPLQGAGHSQGISGAIPIPIGLLSVALAPELLFRDQIYRKITAN
jgi:hypothetical protein